MYCRKCGAPNDDQAASCDKCGTALQSDGLAGNGVAPARSTAVQYASLWRRFAAYLIDNLSVGAIIYLPVFLVLIATGVISSSDMQAGATTEQYRDYLLVVYIVGAAGLVPEIVFLAAMESSGFQATPGKMLLGIKVTDIDGNRVSLVRAIGRNLAKNAPSAFLAGLTILLYAVASDPRAMRALTSLLYTLLPIPFFLVIAFTQKKQGVHDMMANSLVVMKKPRPETGAPVPAFSASAEYAGLLRRLAAALIDGVLLIIAFFAVFVIIGDVHSVITGQHAHPWPDSTRDAIGDAAFAATVILGWLYYAVMESSNWQATLGKMALRLRVTDSSGKRLPFAKAIVRSLGRILSVMMLGLGFVTIAFTEKQQCLHDIMPDTVVVKR
jgi:uncharacterized RDD family membrane protein YckC